MFMYGSDVYTMCCTVCTYNVLPRLVRVVLPVNVLSTFSTCCTCVLRIQLYLVYGVLGLRIMFVVFSGGYTYNILCSSSTGCTRRLWVASSTYFSAHQKIAHSDQRPSCHSSHCNSLRRRFLRIRHTRYC